MGCDWDWACARGYGKVYGKVCDSESHSAYDSGSEYAKACGSVKGCEMACATE